MSLIAPCPNAALIILRSRVALFLRSSLFSLLPLTNLSNIKVGVDYRMITEMRNITEVLWTPTPTHPTISYIELVVRDKNNLNKTYGIVLY